MNREIAHVLEQCHTTRQLVAHLLDLDPGADGHGGDVRVLFGCNYGDYHRTQQTLPVEDLDMFSSGDLHESGYSHSGVAMNDRDEPDDEDVEDEDEVEDVIIIT